MWRVTFFEVDSASISSNSAILSSPVVMPQVITGDTGMSLLRDTARHNVYSICGMLVSKITDVYKITVLSERIMIFIMPGCSMRKSLKVIIIDLLLIIHYC